MRKMREWFGSNIWKMLFAIEVVLIGLLVLLKMSEPLEDYEIPIMSGSPDIGELYAEGGYYTFDQDGDATAALELDDYIPFHLCLPVKAGSYTITINYKSSSYSKLRLFSPSSPLAVQCDDFMLYENKEQLVSNFVVKQDVEDLDVCVKYGGYGYFDVRSISISGNHKDVLPDVIILLLVCAMLDFGYWIYRKKLTFSNCEQLRIGFSLLTFAIMASIPMMIGFLPVMDDFVFSFVRIEGIKDAILEGQIPAVILPNSMLGYGYADPVFYPNLFLYIPAFFRILGFNFMQSYKAFIFLMHLLTAGIAYYSVTKVFNSKYIGLCGSFIYTFSIYRLIDVYRRAALGEFCAIAFLPLLVYGFYRIIIDDTEDEHYKDSWIPFTIGLWGLANTHILTCEMTALFLIPICLICIKRVFEKKRLLQLLKSIGITLLLTAYFIIPFIDMSLKDSYKVFSFEQNDVAENAISLFQTFSLFFSQLGSAVGYAQGNPPRDLGIGFVFLIGIILFIYTKFRNNETDDELKEKLKNRFLVICLLFGCIAVWMTTYHFPWTRLGAAGGVIKKVLYMVQFPWRYTAIATVLLLFVLCEVVRVFDTIQWNKYRSTIMTLFLLTVLVQTLYYFQTVPREGEMLYYYEEAGLPMSGGNGYGEYEPTEFKDIKLGDTIWMLQETFGNSNESIEIKEFDRYGTDSVLTVNNLSTEEQKVYLPILYYPGYVAFDIFSEDPLQVFKSEKGTLGIVLPAGYVSAVKIEYHICGLYRIGEAITLLTLFFCFFVYYNRRHRISERIRTKL